MFALNNITMKKINILTLTSLLFLTGCNVKENINKILSKSKINETSKTTNENTKINNSKNKINIEEELKKLDQEILKLSHENENEEPFISKMKLHIINTLKNSRHKIEKCEESLSDITAQAYLDFLIENEEDFKEYIVIEDKKKGKFEN